MRKPAFCLLALAVIFVLPACSHRPGVSGRSEVTGRFDRAEKFGQFVDGVKETTRLDKKIPVGDFTVYLRGLVKEGDGTWTLDYSGLDSAGNKVDAAIDAGL